jgi:hypothetical protein
MRPSDAFSLDYSSALELAKEVSSGMFFLLYGAVQSARKGFSMFGTGQKLPLQGDRFNPFTASKTERWIVTIVTRKMCKTWR